MVVKTKILLLISIPIIFSGNSVTTVLAEYCGRCVGSAYCSACTTCNYCKHCNSGGSCGVCGGGASSRSDYNKRSPNYPRYTPPTTYSPPTNNYEKKTYIQYFVNTNLLNVRSGPGINYNIIDRIIYAQKVKVEFDLNDGWCYIKYINTYNLMSNGFVSKKYLAYHIISE